MDRMIALSCLCGESRVDVVRRPDYLHECNCALCRKTGALWGYFDPAEVHVKGSTRTFSRTDKDEPTASIRFCATCGATTHFVLTEAAAEKFGNVMVGVNMRLADERDLAGLEIRYPDGAGWAGTGAFDYVRPARVIP